MPEQYKNRIYLLCAPMQPGCTPPCIRISSRVRWWKRLSPSWCRRPWRRMYRAGMQPKILLVNPPIYDFSAYDFWLKPYGLLRVAGYLRAPAQRPGTWERGPFYAENAPKPAPFAAIPRTYRRYGLPRSLLQTMLAEAGPFEVALIQTVMTYWYPGVQEVIADIRASSPQTTIVLGGVYATLCPQHARGLGADLVIDRDHLDPLWQLLRLTPQLQEGPLSE